MGWHLCMMLTAMQVGNLCDFFKLEAFRFRSIFPHSPLLTISLPYST